MGNGTWAWAKLNHKIMISTVRNGNLQKQTYSKKKARLDIPIDPCPKSANSNTAPVFSTCKLRDNQYEHSTTKLLMAKEVNYPSIFKICNRL